MSLSSEQKSSIVAEYSRADADTGSPDGPRAGSAWSDYYFIPTNTTIDPEVAFLVIMEAIDQRSQQDAAEYGIVSRGAALEFGGPYLEAAGQTIAEGIGIYSLHPANGIARAKLGEFLPLVGSGDMTAEEALNAAAEAYTEEATAQGFID